MKKRLIALIICLSFLLSGCADAAQGDSSVQEPPSAAVEEESVVIPDAEGAQGVDKKETVHVTADPSGSVQEMTVEAVLSDLGDAPSIADFSTLTDIRNTEGDEAFRQDADGSITWQNHGNSITYEGKTAKELPVSVHITYLLDGEEITPAQLAGKSGRVTIRFDYENRTAQTHTVAQADLSAVKLDSEEELDSLEDYKTPVKDAEKETIVPFLALSMAMLDDSFSNVEVTHGEVLDFGGRQIVLGYALPGVRECLALEDYEVTQEVELSNYVEFSADVTDFSLDFTATMFSNGLLEELEEDDLADLDDLAVSMKLLGLFSDTLADGTEELSDGTNELSDAMKSYLDGTKELSSGISQLSQALTALDKTLSGVSIPEGSGGEKDVKAITSDLSAVAGVLSDLKDYITGVKTAEAVLSGIDTEGMTDEQISALKQAKNTLHDLDTPDLSGAVSALNDLKERLEKLSDAMGGVSEMGGKLNELKNGISELSAGAKKLNSGAKKLTGYNKSIKKGLNSLTKGTKELAKGMNSFDEDGIDKLQDKAGEKLTNLIAVVRAMKAADAGYCNYSGIHEDMTGSVTFIVETEEIP